MTKTPEFDGIKTDGEDGELRELVNPSFREKLADAIYSIYGGSWGTALGVADMQLKLIAAEKRKAVEEVIQAIEDTTADKRDGMIWIDYDELKDRVSHLKSNNQEEKEG